MHLVERMTFDIPQCFFCGAGNTPYEEEHRVGPFIDTERETGWGDHIYICMRPSCAGMIAVLADFISPDTAKDQRRTIKKLQKELHDARAAQESAERRARGRKKVAA